MKTSLPKLLAAASLSLTLALTGVMATSSPARADNENLHRFIGGAAALFILGTALSNNRNHGYHAPVTRHVVPGGFYAPSHCYNSWRGPHGTYRGFGAHCMQSSPHHARLPGSCLQRVFTYQGWRHVYDAQCLYRHGWVRS